MRMVWRQLTEGLVARGDHGGLELSDGVVFDSGRVGQIARHASDGRRQSGIGVDLQAIVLDSVSTVRSRVLRRKLPGSPGNSIDRRRRAAPYPAPCKSCSIFRKCTALPSCRSGANDGTWHAAAPP